MTEYDYSPEAYERYLATQNRIANWVDKTEQHRSQFQNALVSVPTANASPSRPGPMPLNSHQRQSKRLPPSSQHHGQRPRELFIPPHSPASESSDDYGDGPGPMPMTSPGMMMYPQQPAYHPMSQPMMSPPLIMVPPSYMTAPHHKSSHHRHRSPHSHSHSRSHSQQTPAYYNMASPPIAPGYQYPFPQMMGGGHPGYIMMQPQQQFGARPQMPIMTGLPEPPRSAPPNLTSFPVLPTHPAPASGGAGGYLHARPHAVGGPSSASTSPSLSPGTGTDAWSYGAASPSHSVVSASTGTGTGTVGVTTATTQSHYFTSIPQYQRIHSAMASPPPNTYIVPGPSQPNGPAVIPPNLHQRVYDLSTGGSRHYLRRSVG